MPLCDDRASTTTEPSSGVDDEVRRPKSAIAISRPRADPDLFACPRCEVLFRIDALPARDCAEDGENEDERREQRAPPLARMVGGTRGVLERRDARASVGRTADQIRRALSIRPEHRERLGGIDVDERRSELSALDRRSALRGREECLALDDVRPTFALERQVNEGAGHLACRNRAVPLEPFEEGPEARKDGGHRRETDPFADTELGAIASQERRSNDDVRQPRRRHARLDLGFRREVEPTRRIGADRGDQREDRPRLNRLHGIEQPQRIVTIDSAEGVIGPSFPAGSPEATEENVGSITRQRCVALVAFVVEDDLLDLLGKTFRLGRSHEGNRVDVVALGEERYELGADEPCGSGDDDPATRSFGHRSDVVRVSRERKRRPDVAVSDVEASGPSQRSSAIVPVVNRAMFASYVKESYASRSEVFVRSEQERTS